MIGACGLFGLGERLVATRNFAGSKGIIATRYLAGGIGYFYILEFLRIEKFHHWFLS